MDVQGAIHVFGEAGAVISDAQPQLSLFTFQFFDVTFAGLRESMKGKEDSHRGLAIEATDVRRAGSDQRMDRAFRLSVSDLFCRSQSQS